MTDFNSINAKRQELRDDGYRPVRSTDDIWTKGDYFTQQWRRIDKSGRKPKIVEITFDRIQAPILNMVDIWNDPETKNRTDSLEDVYEVSQEFYAMFASNQPQIFMESVFAFVARHPSDEWDVTVKPEYPGSSKIVFRAKRRTEK